MRTRNFSLALFAVLFSAFTSSNLPAQTLDFENLVLNQQYDLDAATLGEPDSFVTNGVLVELGEFFFGGGGSTTDGFCRSLQRRLGRRCR